MIKYRGGEGILLREAGILTPSRYSLIHHSDRLRPSSGLPTVHNGHLLCDALSAFPAIFWGFATIFWGFATEQKLGSVCDRGISQSWLHKHKAGKGPKAKFLATSH